MAVAVIAVVFLSTNTVRFNARKVRGFVYCRARTHFAVVVICCSRTIQLRSVSIVSWMVAENVKERTNERMPNVDEMKLMHSSDKALADSSTKQL